MAERRTDCPNDPKGQFEQQKGGWTSVFGGRQREFVHRQCPIGGRWKMAV